MRVKENGLFLCWENCDVIKGGGGVQRFRSKNGVKLCKPLKHVKQILLTAVGLLECSQPIFDKLIDYFQSSRNTVQYLSACSFVSLIFCFQLGMFIT